MTWTLASAALATIATVSIIFGFFGGRRFAEKKFEGPIQDFVLANRELGKLNIVQLLLSTSFSLNGMLYQIWLGYTIGMWGLAVQGVWALSYWWLARYMDGVREASSLHAFLGKHFGEKTRILAAVCSIIGFAILVGWEFNVGKSTFAGLLAGTQSMPANFLTLFLVATVLVSVVYTAMGGLGGDAFADAVQNTLKLSIYGLMIYLLYLGVSHAGAGGTFRLRLFPSFWTAVEQLGIFGFITNVAFSIVWQFVDMSTWQSVIASKERLSDGDAKKALRRSGIAVFIAPGLLGTLLGALLVNASAVTSDNVMTKLVSLLPSNPMLTFFVFVALLATIMSMVDGVLLAASYSFVCDILFRRTSLEVLDQKKPRAYAILALLRIVLAVVAIAGGLGVMVLIEWFHFSLFNITYVLVISQLALVGPVFRGLRKKLSAGDRMALAIVAGLVVGFGTLSFGQWQGIDWMVTGAGFFTIIASMAVALLVSRRENMGQAA